MDFKNVPQFGIKKHRYFRKLKSSFLKKSGFGQQINSLLVFVVNNWPQNSKIGHTAG